MTFKGTLR